MGRGLIALAAVIGSLMAVSAAPAMAAVHWSDTTHGIKVSGSVKVTSGGTTRTCTASSKQEYYYFENNTAVLETSGAMFGQLEYLCTGGNSRFGIVFPIEATSTTSAKVGLNTESALWEFTWAPVFYSEQVVTADFANGSGATPSTLSFVADKLGTAPGTGAITINGSLNVTTSSGGLLTLLP